ncbi:MAG TPA: fumarylacetoacetate hydrolase family protein [Vicinamibacterales bacterium]|nr:fumarylacetoacetate hydrolase family protein [Vicinamibacterales bacterium]
MIRLYATTSGLTLERDGVFAGVPDVAAIDGIFRAGDPHGEAAALFDRGSRTQAPDRLRPPLLSQEVWAAGVTYYRSRTARMEESKDAGGGSFYDRVYEADRPELFFKATPHRVVGPGEPVRIRSDSRWNVPEPELTLAINSRGTIFGYTIGNDMSSRDIEGENPLYLPQAKVYAGSAALGPCLVIDRALPGPEATIGIAIARGGAPVFSGETTIGRIKRPLPSLAEWLFRDNSFPDGCYLMTGTGIVPPDAFTLAAGDEIRITLEPVGTLVNTVAPPGA